MRRPWYPLLLAAFPVLFAFAHNAGEVSPAGLVRPLVVVVAAAALLQVGLRRLLHDSVCAARLGAVFWLWFFSRGHYCLLLGRFGLWQPDWLWLAFTVWTLLLAVPVWPILRLRGVATYCYPSINAAAMVLVGLQVWSIGLSLYRQAQHPWPQPSMAGWDVRPGPAAHRPNIYFIVLDSYGRDDVLRRFYGIDNRDFLNFLESKGFYIARESSASYYTTLMSLASSFNLGYLDELVRAAPPGNHDKQPAIHYTAANRLCRVLRAAGYRTVSCGRPATFWTMDDADVAFDRPLLTNFEWLLLAQTPLVGLAECDPYAAHRRQIESSLRRLADAEDLPGPVFVYAHIMCPHAPLIFRADGTTRPTAENYWEEMQISRDLPRPVWRRRYAEQVRFINTLVKPAIEHLLAKAGPDTIVIIQGDHGPSMSSARADFRETMAILNAVRLPGGERRLAPDLAPVNTFRLVLNRALDLDLPLLENRHHFIYLSSPYKPEPVTAAELCRLPDPTAATGTGKPACAGMPPPAPGSGPSSAPAPPSAGPRTPGSSRAAPTARPPAAGPQSPAPTPR